MYKATLEAPAYGADEVEYDGKLFRVGDEGVEVTNAIKEALEQTQHQFSFKEVKDARTNVQKADKDEKPQE